MLESTKLMTDVDPRLTASAARLAARSVVDWHQHPERLEGEIGSVFKIGNTTIKTDQTEDTVLFEAVCILRAVSSPLENPYSINMTQQWWFNVTKGVTRENVVRVLGHA